ncbi:hypothetical protein PGF_00003310 [Porphyromonas gingivalis 381]|nr:hypothetical protein PGF_00003310 [Porphyromonas gingivalis 381]
MNRRERDLCKIKKYLFGIVFTRRACRTSHRGAEVFISITTQKNSQLTMKSPGKCRATVSSIGLTARTEPPTPRTCHPAESR